MHVNRIKFFITAHLQVHFLQTSNIRKILSKTAKNRENGKRIAVNRRAEKAPFLEEYHYFQQRPDVNSQKHRYEV